MITSSKYTHSGKLIRVLDLINPTDKSERRNIINFYDKKMSAVLTFINYHEDPNNEMIKQSMASLLEEAFEGFAAVIQQAIDEEAHEISDEDTRPAAPSLYQQYLDGIASEIKAVIAREQVTPETIEIACIKLAMLYDLSLGIDIIEDIDISVVFKIGIEEPNKFKRQAIGQYISTPILAPEYPDIRGILPIYSSTGSIGLNTMLFAIFNGYLPVGIGHKPLAVHAGFFHNRCFETMQHDYGHMLSRITKMKTEHPETFEKYKHVYENTLDKKALGEIDDLTFLKDLQMLFFLVNEISFHPGEKPPLAFIQDRTQSPAEAGEFFIACEQKLDGTISQDDEAKYRLNTEEKAKTVLNCLIEDSIDFVVPLRNIGYTVDYDLNRPYKSAAQLRAGLIDLYEGFASRHQAVLDFLPAQSSRSSLRKGP